MKRKSADWYWPRVPSKRFGIEVLEEPEFRGYLARMEMLEVREPLWVECCGKRICIADGGFVWNKYFVPGAHHSLTVWFDVEGQPIQYYFDICADIGLDAAGVPWYDDLYLDVVGLPGGPFELIDVEELEAAIQQGAVTQAQYDLAWAEARRLLQRLNDGDYPLLEVSLRHFKTLI